MRHVEQPANAVVAAAFDEGWYRFEVPLAGYNHDAGLGPDAGDVSWGGAMSRNLCPDELDLTESGELVSAMSEAVGRLRQQAAAAFYAGREEPAGPAATQPDGDVDAEPARVVSEHDGGSVR